MRDSKAVNADLVRLKVNDIEMALRDQGSGDAVVLVHGFPFSHTMWRQQWDVLSKNHRVIVPDLRGFGQSDVTSGTVTMAQFADDLAAMLDVLDIGDVTFCGLSMGGYIAWEFWRRHGHRVSKFILCDTRAVADDELIARGRQWMVSRLLQEGTGFVPETMLPKLFSPHAIETTMDVVDEARDSILNAPVEGMAASLRGMAQRMDASSLLAEVNVPALLLAGEHDQISPCTEMQQIAATMPQGTFVSIEGAAHVPPMETPEEFNTAVLAFLDQRSSDQE